MKHHNKSTTSLTQFIRGIGLKLRVKPNRAAPAWAQARPEFLGGLFCNSDPTTGISLVVPAVCSAAQPTIRLPCWPPFRFPFLAFVTIATMIVCSYSLTPLIDVLPDQVRYSERMQEALLLAGFRPPSIYQTLEPHAAI